MVEMVQDASRAYGRSRRCAAPAQARAAPDDLIWLLPPVAWFTVFILVPYAMLLWYQPRPCRTTCASCPGLSLATICARLHHRSLSRRDPQIGPHRADHLDPVASIVAWPLAFAIAFHAQVGLGSGSLLYLLVIVPWWASYLVKAYAWKTILGTNGILNATRFRAWA
jgi:spermidine/putrescine transport system permease protein